MTPASVYVSPGRQSATRTGRSFEACLVVNDLLATIDAIKAKAGFGIRPSLVATHDIAASKWLWQEQKMLYEEGSTTVKRIRFYFRMWFNRPLKGFTNRLP